MGITIGEPLVNNAVDATFNPTPNIDGAYGPYATTTAANTAIPLAKRSPGLTVGIKSGQTVVEYWYNGGTANANLVPKSGSSSGGSGTGVNFQVNTGVTDTTVYLEAQYPNAAVPTFVVDSTSGATYIKFAAESWIKIEGTVLSNALPTAAKITGANVLNFK